MLENLAVRSNLLRAGSMRCAVIAILGAGVATGLAGCSADKVLDAVNPVNLYHDVVDDTPKTDAQNQANLEAGSKEDYPNLSTVPEEPTQGLTTAERQKLAEGLVADREHARHTDDLIRQGDSSAVAPAPVVLPEEQFKSASNPQAGQLPSKTVPVPRDTPEPQATADAPPAPSLKPVPPPTPITPPNSAPPVAALPGPQTAAAPSVPPPPPGDTLKAAPAIASGSASSGSASSGSSATGSSGIGSSGTGTRSLLGSVTFPQGSNSVPADAASTLSGVPAALFGQPGNIRVIGRAAAPETGADPAGRQLAGYQAALAHAGAVKDALVKAGIPASRVMTEAAPASDADPGAADRADIYVER